MCVGKIESAFHLRKSIRHNAARLLTRVRAFLLDNYFYAIAYLTAAEVHSI